jgi:hypothetical protein
MSREESAFWRARAEQLRAVAKTMEEGIAREVVYRIAEDYEMFAQSIEQRPNRFVPPEEIVPPEVEQYGGRKGSPGAPPPLVPEDIPTLLKRAHTEGNGPLGDDQS